MKYLLVIITFILSLPIVAQTPTFDELSFEPDSVKAIYKPSSKNYVFLRSKRGNSGLTKTPVADAMLTAEVTEIVLVFTENDAAALAEREEANRERWENLLMTYPEFFQYSTTYKNLCQCKSSGDGEALKQAQGFYIYVNAEVPKMEEPKIAETPPPAPKKAEDAPAPAPKAPKQEEKKITEVEKPAVKANEPPAVKETPAVVEKKEIKKDEVKKEVENHPVEPAATEETAATEVHKTSPTKRVGTISKVRKSKDKKACRTACYESGDDDLVNYFKQNIKLSKKQRKKGKHMNAVAKLQLDVDGTIKKAMVTGENEDFNKMVQEAVNGMSAWNSSVKNGVTVKSEVKITLKYDKGTKSIIPFEVAVNPRQPPKCKCASDSEIFGSTD